MDATGDELVFYGAECGPETSYGSGYVLWMLAGA